MLLVSIVSCAGSHLSVAPPLADPFGPEWAAERAAVFDSINRARAEAGVSPLVYRSILERVGDLHCRSLVAEGALGHFATDGVPPYLRYLLAGGVGFHRENVGSLSTNYRLESDDVGAFLADSLTRMLAEQPPHDGHRRTLLDRDVTVVGIGIAVEGGEARVTHEFAVEACRSSVPPPSLAPPSTIVRLEATLAAPWQVAAVEVLREGLPAPLSRTEANERSVYRYPPGRAVFGDDGLGPGLHGGKGPRPLRLGPGDSFSFSWFTGPAEGIEIALVWARRHPGSAESVAVASFATIVTGEPALPAALQRYCSLRLPEDPGRSPAASTKPEGQANR